MSEVQHALDNAVSFECKKDGLQQRQSGDWVLRVTVQAIDMHQTIVTASMGTRFQCVLVEVNDDETPVDHKAMERDKWRDLGPTKQAALRCKDPVFWAFLSEEGFPRGNLFPCDNENDAAFFVREFLAIDSRSDLGKPGQSQARLAWHNLDFAFQAWKVAEHA